MPDSLSATKGFTLSTRQRIPDCLTLRHMRLNIMVVCSIVLGGAYTSAQAVTPKPSISFAVSQPASALNASTQAAAPLPNAYELVTKLDAQQRQMAQMAGQIETLKMQVDTLQTQIDTQTNTLMAELLTNLQPTLDAQIAQQVAIEVNQQLAAIESDKAANTRERNAPIPNSPYLVMPSSLSSQPVTTSESAIDITLPSSVISRSSGIGAATNSNSLIEKIQDSTNATSNMPVLSAEQQGERDYRLAYALLKQEGADAAVAQMQRFIETYPNHTLIPKAHYWLGEFYLKQEPANIGLATQQFTQVVTTFNDDPNNTMQSKALFRLANFARTQGQSAQANAYINTLLESYPDSKEAQLAKSVIW